MNLHFNIAPLAVQSVRFTRQGRAYQPWRIAAYKKALATAAYTQLPADWELMTGAVSVSAVFAFAPPKSLSKSDTARISQGHTVYKTSRPDCDNLFKGLADSLNGVVWADDSQIVQLNLTKTYSQTEGITMTVESAKTLQDTTTGSPSTQTLKPLPPTPPRWRETWDYASDGKHLSKCPAKTPKRATGHARLF